MKKVIFNKSEDWESGKPDVVTTNKEISFRKCNNSLEIILEVTREYESGSFRKSHEIICIPYNSSEYENLKDLLGG